MEAAHAGLVGAADAWAGAERLGPAWRRARSVADDQRGTTDAGIVGGWGGESTWEMGGGLLTVRPMRCC